MARGRMISASLGSSRRFRRLGATAKGLGEFAQALFSLIVANTDAYGLLKSDPESVKLEVFPSSPRSERDFEAAIRAMASSEVGLIRLYEAEGERYLEVLKFDEHQPGLHPRGSSKRGTPKYPLPPDISATAAVAATDAAVEREGERETESETESETKAASGKRQARGRSSRICDVDFLSELQAQPAYERLDVNHVFNKMQVWCKQKRKEPTRSRLINWLNREDQPLNGNARTNTNSGAGNRTGEQTYPDPDSYRGANVTVIGELPKRM